MDLTKNHGEAMFERHLSISLKLLVLSTMLYGVTPVAYAKSTMSSIGVSTTGYMEGVSATGAWVATQAEAEAGANNDQVMTPLRVKQAIAATSTGDDLGNHTATTTLNMGANKIQFSNTAADKAYYYSNTYGRGIESSTLTDWSGSQFRWRIGGTSASTGSQQMLLNLTGLNVSGSLSVNTDDAVTAPGFTWNGDNNTGLYWVAADQIGITTGGVQRALINSTGLTVTGAIAGTTAAGAWVATQAEAEAGTNNDQVMTPLRVKQAIAIQSGMNSTVESGWPDAIFCSGTSSDGMMMVKGYALPTGERYYVYGDGNFHILFNTNGTYASAGSSSTYYTSCVSKSISQLYSAGQAFNFVNGTASVSDYRLKQDVTPLPDALARVMQLKPHRYHFVTDVSTTQEGFLAHELQEIVPYAVTGKKDEVDAEGAPVFQRVDYAKVVPLLAAAIQDLQNENRQLREELADIREDLKKL